MVLMVKPGGCFLYYKGTKMRANHNKLELILRNYQAVSYITKVLK